MKNAFRYFAIAVFAASAALISTISSAQSYPAKPVRLIVPWPPGGVADFLGRLLAQKLSEAWGTQIIVDNRAGGGTNIGSELAVKAPPDGYTLLLASTNNAVNMTLYKALSYNIEKDLLPITLVAQVPNILVAHPSLPAGNVKELIALAKSRPGKLTYASAGNGSPAHLAAELFKLAAGVDMLNVPYKGAGPAVNDLMGGQVDLMFTNVAATLQQIQAGRLKALAMAGANRAAALPTLPTIAESGLPGYEASAWYGVMAPAALPKDIATKLQIDISRVVKSGDFKEKLVQQGAEAVGNTQAEFASIIHSDIDKYAKVIKTAGIKIE